MNKSSGLFKAVGIIAIIEGIFILVTTSWLVIPIAIGVPAIIGGSCFLRYSNMTNQEFYLVKSSALAWSIFFLLHCSTVVGVLAIIGVNQMQEEPFTVTYPDNNTNCQVIERSDLEKIERLNILKQRGIIDDEEYQRLKSEILKIEK